MKDTATPLPDWFRAADDAYQAERLERQTDRYTELKKQADSINDLLARLGVTAIRPAEVGQALHLVPALLLAYDEEEGGYEVSATWNPDHGLVALAVRDAEDLPHGKPQLARALESIADIAAARYNGAPAPKPAPLDLLDLALSTLKTPSADHLSPEGHAIAVHLAGLTAAVLHHADTISRVASRP